MGTHREIAFRVDQGKGVLSPIETVLGSEHLGCDYYSRVCLQGTKLGKDMLVGWEEGVVPKYYAVRTQIGTRDSRALIRQLWGRGAEADRRNDRRVVPVPRI